MELLLVIKGPWIAAGALDPSLFVTDDDLYDKGGNLEYRTSHAVLDVSLKIEPHLCVNVYVVYWAHIAVSKCHSSSLAYL
jgi:hypothetical protein